MNAILFSANPSIVNVKDAIKHLSKNTELYWEVGFRIIPHQFKYPILGYMHICGKQVEYVAKISAIIPFSIYQYENKELAFNVKPIEWIKDWNENKNNIRNYKWKNTLVITEIQPFFYDTYSFQKLNGCLVTKAPQNYIRVLQNVK